MTELTEQQRIEAIASHIESIISLIGDDVEREGLSLTPMRAAKALAYLTAGYAADTDQVVGQALFQHDGSQMVVVKDIEFYSLCEHHILPFFGKISIAYLPNDKIVGLSKIARIVDVYARRLQVQERFTAQIVDDVRRITGAKGVIAISSAEHLCMKMRGVEKQRSTTTTMHYNGDFNDPALRAEFLAAIK